MSTSLQPCRLQHSRSSVPHCLPELAQIHVHWVSDTIQPSHPLPPPSPFVFNLSQHQGLFQWVGSSHQVAKTSVSAWVLPMNIQGGFPLGFTGLISLLSKGLSRVFSSTAIQKHQFFCTRFSLWSNSHIYRETISIETYVENHKNILRKTITLTIRTFTLLVFTNLTGKQWNWIFILFVNNF